MVRTVRIADAIKQAFEPVAPGIELALLCGFFMTMHAFLTLSNMRPRIPQNDHLYWLFSLLLIK
jgi:hypothetical protein